MGLLTSGSYLGPCIGSFIGGKGIMPFYQKWDFLTFSIPCGIVFILLLLPPFYRLLATPPPIPKVEEEPLLLQNDDE